MTEPNLIDSEIPELPTPPSEFPWPQAGGAYRADPLTGELTRLNEQAPETVEE